MDHELIATATIKIKAPIDVVWHSLTDPEAVKQTMWGTQLSADWHEGGKIFFRGEWEGKPYEDKGVILSYNPPRQLTYSYYSAMTGLEDKPENYGTVDYTLEESGDNVKITITQTGARDETARSHSEQGWNGILQQLKQTLEQN